MSAPQEPFSLWSGVGLVVANMVGVGVFLSTGFMADSMSPGTIMLAWGTGAVLALAGARAYGEVATSLPRSGGEYRYLSTLIHPSLGFLAGWASLLVGFSAPIAADAVAAGKFATVLFGVPWQPVAIGLVLGLAVVHAIGLHVSTRAQNWLVAVKALLLVGFVVAGATVGSLAWPAWEPPHPSSTPVEGFFQSLFYIAFAFSGWNAAAYAADEFRDAKRTVPRAMVLGCALVALLYLALNYVFVANLAPQQLSVVFGYDTAQVTVGHALAEKLAGPVAAKVVTAVILLAFVSAMSAMTIVGPRVYAAMAADGVLPKALGAKEGKPPTWAVFLQAGLALVVLFTHSLQEVLKNVGAVLTLFAALTVLSLFWVRFRVPGARPTLLGYVSAAAYFTFAMVMLWFGFREKTHLLPWLLGIAVCAIVGWLVVGRRLRPAAAAPP